MWKAGGGKTYPPPNEVTPIGHAVQDDPLADQHVHRPAHAARQGKGDYTYTRLAGGKKYSLVAYLSDGSTIGK